MSTLLCNPHYFTLLFEIVLIANFIFEYSRVQAQPGNEFGID